MIALAPAEADDPLGAALRYASAGYPVFALAPGSKSPYGGTNGLRDASTDPVAIREMFADRPDANVGLRPPDGMFAVDVDGPVGAETLRGIFKEHGQAASPATSTATTPGKGGGHHYLFRSAEGVTVPTRVGALPGIDVRGPDGYIVVWPSVHPDGGAYSWDASPFDMVPAVAPDWLVDVLSHPRDSRPGVTPTGDDCYREGERNSGLTAYAGRLRAGGLDAEQLLARLLFENAQRCIPPLPEPEVRKIADSVARYATDGVPEPTPRFTVIARSALRGRPAIEWLIDGVLPAGSLSMLYGPSNLGKTFVALHLAHAIASELDWLGHETSKGAVVYVEAESQPDFNTRLTAVEEYREAWLSDSDFFVVQDAPNLADEASVTAFIETLESLDERPALVIFDTLARCMVGADENSAMSMGQVIRGLDRIKALGCAVMVVHHPTKAGDTIRGSSALYAGLDVVMFLGVRDAFPTLSCEKLKVAAPFAPMPITLERCGETLVASLADRRAVATNTLKKHVPDVLDAIRDLANGSDDGWVRQSDIRTRTGLRLGSALTNALSSAEAAGLIEGRGDPRKREYRLFPDDDTTTN